MGIEIIRTGLLTSVQDRGRFHFRSYGVPVSGALDQESYRLGNALLGNTCSAPCLEMTFAGGQFKFLEETDIAITGANMSPIDEQGYPIPMWQTVHVHKNQVITFSTVVEGMRTYLAVAGGFKVQKIMDSASTYGRAGIYPAFGRPLKVGDILAFEKVPSAALFHRIAIKDRPQYKNEICVRVVLGPHDEAFTREGMETFLKESYKVTPNSDRMGIRLEGAKIQHVSTADIISDGIVPGAIQVPKEGQPIVLMGDAQTTGGYTKIAHVIQTDLCKLAQLKPEDQVTFKAISLKEAHELYKQNEKHLVQMLQTREKMDQKKLCVTVLGKPYKIVVDEV